MKQKVTRARNAYRYLLDLLSLDTKVNFAKIATDLEIDLDEQMLVDGTADKGSMSGGKEKMDREKYTKLKTIGSLEDVHTKLQLIIQTIVEEEKAVIGLYSSALQMKKLLNQQA